MSKNLEGSTKPVLKCKHCRDRGYILGLETACAYCNPDGSWRGSKSYDDKLQSWIDKHGN